MLNSVDLFYVDPYKLLLETSAIGTKRIESKAIRSANVYDEQKQTS